MFNKFQTPAIYLSNTALPAQIQSFGSATGIVVESGDSISSVVPIYNGNPLPHAMNTLELAGSNVNDHLIEHMLDRKHGWLHCNTSANSYFTKENYAA